VQANWRSGRFGVPERGISGRAEYGGMAGMFSI